MYCGLALTGGCGAGWFFFFAISFIFSIGVSSSEISSSNASFLIRFFLSLKITLFFYIINKKNFCYLIINDIDLDRPFYKYFHFLLLVELPCLFRLNYKLYLKFGNFFSFKL